MSEKNILEEIAEKTRERIRKEKLQFPLDQLKIARYTRLAKEDILKLN